MNKIITDKTNKKRVGRVTRHVGLNISHFGDEPFQATCTENSSCIRKHTNMQNTRKTKLKPKGSSSLVRTEIAEYCAQQQATDT